MDKQSNFFKEELSQYMKQTLGISKYQTELFIHLLLKRGTDNLSLENIQNIYRIALKEAEYVNKKKIDHDFCISHIYKKIKSNN